MQQSCGWEQGSGWVQSAGIGSQALCALLISRLAVPMVLSRLVWGTCTLGSAYLYSLCEDGHRGVKILGRAGMLKSQKVVAMF